MTDAYGLELFGRDPTITRLWIGRVRAKKATNQFAADPTK
jgi:hypothetical protein